MVSVIYKYKNDPIFLAGVIVKPAVRILFGELSSDIVFWFMAFGLVGKNLIKYILDVFKYNDFWISS
jgi:hypothetical protein